MTELEADTEMSRTEVATYLREFAAHLDPSAGVPNSTHFRVTEADDQRVTFLAGNDSATIDPPSPVAFSVRVDSNSSLIDSETEREVSFGLRWQAKAEEEQQDDLEIK